MDVPFVPVLLASCQVSYSACQIGFNVSYWFQLCFARRMSCRLRFQLLVGNGGAVEFADLPTLDISGTDFDNNVAGNNGGGLSVDVQLGALQSVRIANCTCALYEPAPNPA
jgi:hypothetical protein